MEIVFVVLYFVFVVILAAEIITFNVKNLGIFF